MFMDLGLTFMWASTAKKAAPAPQEIQMMNWESINGLYISQTGFTSFQCDGNSDEECGLRCNYPFVAGTYRWEFDFAVLDQDSIVHTPQIETDICDKEPAHYSQPAHVVITETITATVTGKLFLDFNPTSDWLDGWMEFTINNIKLFKL